MQSESSNGLRHSGGPSKYRDQIRFRYRIFSRFIVILSVIPTVHILIENAMVGFDMILKVLISK